MIDSTEVIAVHQASVPTPSVEGSIEAPLRTSAASKSDCVTKLLRRAKGVTIAEIQESTSWQPHSVRAFLSGLRKKGLDVSKEQRKSGETAYRIPGKAAGMSKPDA